jgi:hypothetical protein
LKTARASGETEPVYKSRAAPRKRAKPPNNNLQDAPKGASLLPSPFSLLPPPSQQAPTLRAHAAGLRRYAPTQQTPDGYASTSRFPPLRAPEQAPAAPRPRGRPPTATRRYSRPRRTPAVTRRPRTTIFHSSLLPRSRSPPLRVHAAGRRPLRTAIAGSAALPPQRAVPAQQSSTPPSSLAAGPRRSASTQQAPDATRPRNSPPMLRVHAAGRRPLRAVIAGPAALPPQRAVPGQQSSTPPSSLATAPRRSASTQQALDGYATTSRPPTLRAHATGPRRLRLDKQVPDAPRPRSRPPTATRCHNRPPTLRVHAAGHRLLRAAIAGPRRSASTQQAADRYAPP